MHENSSNVLFVKAAHRYDLENLFFWTGHIYFTLNKWTNKQTNTNIEKKKQFDNRLCRYVVEGLT